MTADFYDEAGRRARWLGALHGNPDPKPCGDSVADDSCWKPQTRRPLPTP